MQQDKCILCDSSCHKARGPFGDTTYYNYYDCPNCGAYGITRDAVENINSDSKKFKLSCMVKERDIKKYERVIITLQKNGNSSTGEPMLTIDSLINEFPKTAGEIFDRVLMNLGNSVELPSDHIRIDENSRALMFSRSVQEMHYFLQQFAELEYVPKGRTLPATIPIHAKGWERIAKLAASEMTSNQAFVAMWFDRSTDMFYEKGIKPAVEWDKRTKCLRIDKSSHNNKICDQIIAEIRKCKYLIADFTGNRAGVYYEAGFALGLKKPVIWTVQKEHLKDVHFDTRQYNHICYEDENDLFEQLKNRIEATLPQ